jgi:glyoxylase-like metal-dependent hydrolase (beta-lactamase superfamily II)
VSGRILPSFNTSGANPAGAPGQWTSGTKTLQAHLLLAPNASAWTLDGTNTWLLRDPDSAVTIVVDPGPDDTGHLDRIVAHALATDAPIGGIVLTHGHVDHSAGARRLAQQAGVWVRALDPDHRLGGEGLASGDVITAGALEIRVVSTPGHSVDSVSLLLPSEGSLLTGDTVLGRGTTVIAWPDGRFGEYVESLTALRALAEEGAVQRILPGHGPTLMDPAAVLDAYLAHRRMRLEEVRVLVAAGVTAPADLVAAIYVDVDRGLWPAAEMSVRAQLEYLNEL